MTPATTRSEPTVSTPVSKATMSRAGTPCAISWKRSKAAERRGPVTTITGATPSRYRRGRVLEARAQDRRGVAPVPGRVEHHDGLGLRPVVELRAEHDLEDGTDGQQEQQGAEQGDGGSGHAPGGPRDRQGVGGGEAIRSRARRGTRRWGRSRPNSHTGHTRYPVTTP